MTSTTFKFNEFKMHSVLHSNDMGRPNISIAASL